MSKKFKNIENNEAFKNFKLEDYMPSMPEHKSEEVSSAVEQEPVEEGDSLFPVLDEPDTSIVQTAVSESRIQEQKTSVESDDEVVETANRYGQHSRGTDNRQTYQRQTAQAVIGRIPCRLSTSAQDSRPQARVRQWGGT